MAESPEVSKVSVEGFTSGIRMPTLRFSKCPKGIHKIVKTSVVNTETKRNSTHCIPRRYPSYGALSEAGPSACCFDSKSSRGARLYIELPKVGTSSFSTNGVSRVARKLTRLTLSLSLPRDKIRKIQSKSQDLLNNPVTAVRELSKCLGLLSSPIQAIFPALLHSWYLQQAKNSVLRFRKSYEAVVRLDSECL